ncbi:MAG: alginate lyase family protein [Aquitalea sp.]|nr:alginate lyase family protein [Aquitalea sp.]
MFLPFLSRLLLLLALSSSWASMAFARDFSNWCQLKPDPATAGGLLQRSERQLDTPPNPLPRIHTEGTLPHQGIFDQSVKAKQDWQRMRDFALAWYYSSDRRYLDALAHYLDAWTEIYQLSFNPIDETDLDALIDSYAISSRSLPAATREQSILFLRHMVTGYIQQIRQARKPLRATFINNWNSHRIKLITLGAVALQDATLFRTASELYLEQIGNNIDSQGQTWDFVERDALHYVTYDLEPLTRAAIAARQAGEDWLPRKGRQGGSLAMALAWLQPYAEKRLEHQEFVHSQVQFDMVRRDAGLPGYAGNWQVATSRNLFALASRLDPRWRQLNVSSGHAPDWILLCWP